LPGIGVINNPHSRKNRKNPDWMRALGYIVGTKGTSVATKQIEDINDMVRVFKHRDIDVLAINGGDGSNSITLTALIDEYGDRPLPKIALLRGGTMNIAANSCGVKGTPAGLMMNLVDKYREGKPFETTWRDTLCIEGRYGFIFGNGFIHGFLETFYGQGKKSPLRAATLLSRGIGSAMVRGPFARKLFAGVKARVVVDGKELPWRSFAAMAAGTVNQIGLGAKPFFRSQEKAHSFHLLGIICSPFRFVPAVPRIFAGKKVSEKRIVEMVAEEVVLESNEPLKYTLDGENYENGRTLRISTGPRLEILVR
jgi:diacylglycerol kinase family enzyme